MKNRTKIAIGCVAANAVLMLLFVWGFIGAITFMYIIATEATVVAALVIVRELSVMDKEGSQRDRNLNADD
ncbi:MAG: hypothetical protein AAF662_02915 [Pseudomonadota bacterium]